MKILEERKTEKQKNRKTEKQKTKIYQKYVFSGDSKIKINKMK